MSINPPVTPSDPAFNVAKTSAYIFAHQDDWQLFYSPGALFDLGDITNDTVVIILTAGNSGRVNANYFINGRNQGHMRSIQTAADYAPAGAPFKQLPSIWTKDNIKFNNHVLERYTYKTVTFYNIGLDSDTNGLAVLQSGQQVTTYNNMETYINWDDLSNTIVSILNYHRTYIDSDPPRFISVFSSDPDTSMNPGDHPEHYLAGLLSTEVCTILQNQNITPYLYYCMGYHISTLPANIDSQAPPDYVQLKTSVFQAYVNALYYECGWNTWIDGGDYTSFLQRQYTRPQNGVYTIPPN